MEQKFDIQAYMTRGVEHVVTDILKATLRNPRESAYMLRFAAASKRASAKRQEAKKRGEHINVIKLRKTGLHKTCGPVFLNLMTLAAGAGEGRRQSHTISY